MIRRPLRSGFTLAEVLITMAVVLVVGAILFSTLHVISLLTAKNFAINLAHQQARKSVHSLLSGIRESASIPQLIDENRVPLSGAATNGPAAGVSFQTIVAGPYRVWNNANADAKNIRITSLPDDAPPTPGMRLVVPAFQIEADIENVGGFPGNPQVRDIQVATVLGAKIDCNAGNPVYPAYYTQRSAILVKNGELRYYENRATEQYTVVARDVQTPQPFSVPNGDNRFIKVDILVKDSRVSQLGFNAVDLKLSMTVPFRYRLTTRQ